MTQKFKKKIAARFLVLLEDKKVHLKIVFKKKKTKTLRSMKRNKTQGCYGPRSCVRRRRSPNYGNTVKCGFYEH